MRIFDHPNTSGGFSCPVCKKADDKPIVLIGIQGTEEGMNMEAKQVHLDCLDGLRIIDNKFIAMVLEG